MKNKYLSLLIIILFITTPLSSIDDITNYATNKSSNTTVLVIGLRSDNAISLSLNTLLEVNNELKIVDYKNFEILEKTEIMNLIVLGHGDERGIIDEVSLLISWYDLGKKLSSLNVANHFYFLNCKVGDDVSKFIPESKIGFSSSNTIYAIAGALLVSAYISINMKNIVYKSFQSLLSSLVNRVNLIKLNPSEQIFLGLSGNEAGLSIAALFITAAVQALFIWGIPAAMAKYGTQFRNALALRFARIPKIGTWLSSIVAVAETGASASSTISKIFNIMKLVLTKGVAAFKDAMSDTFNWLDMSVMFVSISASLAIIFTTGSTSLWLGLAAAAYPMWKVVRDIHYNYYDRNNYWQDYPFSLSLDLIG